MRGIPSWLIVTGAVVLAGLGGFAIAAQYKYTLQVPGGLSTRLLAGREAPS